MPPPRPTRPRARRPERDQLLAVDLFSGLAAGALDALAAGGTLRRYAAGHALWVAGAEARGLVVVLAGRVRVVRAPGGRQHAVHEEGPGGTLGDVALFDGGRYPATALAAAPTTCLLVDRATLRRAVAADPELAFRLLARLARRVRGLVDRLDARTTRRVGQRLAAHLLALHARAGGGAVRLGTTQAEAAEELGTVREVVVRALRRLRDDGVIMPAGRGRFRVVDVPRLRRLAE